MNIKFDDKEVDKIVLYARVWHSSETDAVRKMIREFVSKEEQTT